MSSAPIPLLLSDVGGPPVTPDKGPTGRSVEGGHKIPPPRVLFPVTTGRPPRGMSMLIEPLDLETPIAAFNGGLVVEPDMSVLAERDIPADLVAPIVKLLESFALDAWVYRGAEWLVRDRD